MLKPVPMSLVGEELYLCKWVTIWISCSHYFAWGSRWDIDNALHVVSSQAAYFPSLMWKSSHQNDNRQITSQRHLISLAQDIQ